MSTRRGRASRGRRGLAIPVRVETAAGAVLQLARDPARPSGRLLLIDGLASAYVDLEDPTNLALDYLRRMADALDALLPRGEPADVVHLGGGGFALPRFLAATRPAVRQEAYEVEPEIVAVAERHLRLRRSPALRVRTGDARALLARRPDASADAIVGDAFSGTQVPHHLATLEFAREVRRVLRPRGVYVLNVVDVPPLDFARGEAATLQRAFAHALAFGARGVLLGRSAGNVLFAASEAPLPAAALARRLAGGPYPSLVRPAGELAQGAAELRDSS